MEMKNNQLVAMFGENELAKLDEQPKRKAVCTQGGAHYVAGADLSTVEGDKYHVTKHWIFSQACIDESGIARTGDRSALDWNGQRPDTQILYNYEEC